MNQTTISRSTPASRIAAVVAVAVLAGVAAAPWWASTAELRLITEILFYLALATMWNLLAGYAGLISVGQHAYVGLGGYLMFSFVLFAGMNPLWSIPLSGLLGALISVPVAWLVFRLKGPYFAIGTWVVAEVFRLTAAVLCVGSILLVYMLLRSRVGLALTAIRDNEIASSSLGVQIGRIKLFVYVAAAAVTTMIGNLIFITKLRISPDAAFSMNDWTVFVIFIVVIGGIGTIEGPIIGTLLYFLLREFLADLGAIYLMILGALAIVIMLAAPKGLWGLLVKRYDFSIFPVGYRVRRK
jgi:branched-chain amino acid transport system permease protein